MAVTMPSVRLENEPRGDPVGRSVAGEPVVSVVIPCLNEEEGITAVVERAWAGLAAAELPGEVIVVDNASVDRSAELAKQAGAIVVDEARRGYGSAYLAGLAAARGRYIVMADADGTYDLMLIVRLVERLESGADMVLGSRFKGTIHPGAMPWLNRRVGNPILTGMLNRLFRTDVSDAHCGLRAIRRDVLPKLALSATGMEFASEMVIKAGKRRLHVDEIPIDYYPRLGESKLARVNDAWRHVRFMLVYSPVALFVWPGVLAAGLSLLGLVLLAALPGLTEAWTGVSVAAAMLTVVGLGMVELGLFARTYAVIYLGEHDPGLERRWRRYRLEHGLALAGVTFFVGIAITLVSFFDGTHDPRLGILGLALAASAVQGSFASFFLSILGLSEHARVYRRP
jgi:hypothetical protein